MRRNGEALEFGLFVHDGLEVAHEQTIRPRNSVAL
jgi:hypothetical protein